jgi:hypothetical protein
MMKNKKFALMAVPTGIGASIGGYAGDASLSAKKISDVIPLIVNPNVVNAAVFSGINANMLYVEGWSMSEFIKGNISLKPSENNKIGVIFDKAVPENVLNIHLNAVNAVKTVYGIDITRYEITEEKAGVEFFIAETGISSGSLNNPKTLVDAGEKLLEKGADVLAVVCHFEEPEDDNYENGIGVDVVGGIEAIISHYLSKELNCPCVHAPAFSDVSITGKLVSPKAGAEYITPTFLPCLFFGLKNAPVIVNGFDENYITYKNVHSVVMPYNSLGSGLVFDALKHGIPVYAVKENKTVLNADKYALNLHNVVEVESYDEYIALINV